VIPHCGNKNVEVHKGQYFLEELLATAAQEFVVGATSTMMVKPATRILGAPIGRFNVEAAPDTAFVSTGGFLPGA
jgi:hypothetical protein